MKFAIIFAMTLVAFAQSSYAAAVPVDENVGSDVKTPVDKNVAAEDAVQDVADHDIDESNQPEENADSDDEDDQPDSTDDDQSNPGVQSEEDSAQEENDKPVVDRKSVVENYSKSRQEVNGKVVDEHSGGQRIEDDNGKIKVTKL
ncbi:uncharacterized protein LOC126372636 [Pectinophora gossypiella]|uniref:uncharacterized protein LOC126372636 n=1 Tax=Pectinophora gossypiella TaxID=13191 RepID=UPI00214E2966|nr:uncharacterized protein LOC126372636 [Pectinophora gossypiella]